MATGTTYWQTQMINWFKGFNQILKEKELTDSERWQWLLVQQLYFEKGHLPDDLNKIREWTGNPSFSEALWTEIKKTFPHYNKGGLQPEVGAVAAVPPSKVQKEAQTDRKKDLIRLLKLYPSLYKNTKRSTEEEWVAKCEEIIHTDQDLLNLEIAIENYTAEQKDKAAESGVTWAEQSKFFKNPLNWLKDWTFYINLEKRDEVITPKKQLSRFHDDPDLPKADKPFDRSKVQVLSSWDEDF